MGEKDQKVNHVHQNAYASSVFSQMLLFRDWCVCYMNEH